MPDFCAAALKTFEELRPAFAANDNYWQLGHTFDTIIDYFVICPNQNNDTDKVGEIAYQRYGATHGSWYDDYGWWAIAGLKAYQNQTLFPSRYQDFRNVAANCWKTMDENAPKVWERADKSRFGALRPLIEGGVWNNDFKNCDDQNPQLCGFQNTVTNGLYVVLASRLYRAFNDPHYAEASVREYEFLKNWLFEVAPPIDPLLNRLAIDQAVVRERVSAYYSGDPVSSYRPDLAWAGDQGLILGGWVERMLIVGRGSPGYDKLLVTAQQIIAGTKRYLASDGLLIPWWPDPAPGDDPDDYRTGIAVYMRYLTYACRENPDLRAYLRDPTSGYLEFVFKNATHVVNNPSQDMAGLANDLAILVAAVALLP